MHENNGEAASPSSATHVQGTAEVVPLCCTIIVLQVGMLAPLTSTLPACTSSLQHCAWPEGVERFSPTLLELYCADNTFLRSGLFLSPGYEGSLSATAKHLLMVTQR